MTGRPDFLAGIESSDREVLFRSLRLMLADLGIENAGLTNEQLEAAVVRFDAMVGWNGLPANVRHEILYRFAKASAAFRGSRSWTKSIHRSPTSSPRVRATIRSWCV